MSPDAPPPDPPDADPPDAHESAHRIALLRQLAETDPGDATAWFLLGRELAAAGRPGEAAPAFASAVRADPDYTAAYRQLGNALEADGRFAEAARAYRDGLAVAQRTQDLQTGREMAAFLKRLARDHGIDGG